VTWARIPCPQSLFKIDSTCRQSPRKTVVVGRSRAMDSSMASRLLAWWMSGIIKVFGMK
jgi:hypothetical protein